MAGSSLIDGHHSTGQYHRTRAGDIRNRRELASLAGLAPVPFASGGIDHDQGISKAGNTMLRKHLQMAWRWLQHQPYSALSKWFRDYVSARDGRSRKRGDRGAGAQAAGGAVALRHRRAGAGGRRPVADLRGGERNIRTPGRPDVASGEPGQGV